MSKRSIISVTAGIAILSISLTACGIGRGTRPSASDNNSIQPGGTSGEMSNIDDVYMEVHDYNRSSILTPPEEYEPGAGERSDEVYAAVNDYVLTAFGMTFQEIEELPTYVSVVLSTLDNSPNRYSMEYQNNRNCSYIFHKNGSDFMGSSDLCVGAEGWFSRIMDFEHESPVTVSELNNTLREIYPDCSEVRFTSTSSIADAPINIRDTLAYMDFTVPFYNTAPTKVRLYVEESSESSYVSSDDWAMICLPDEY